MISLSDRKTITVSAETFDALNATRGETPWDDYLAGVASDGEPSSGVRLSGEQYSALVEDVTAAVERRFERTLSEHLPSQY